MRCAVTHDYHTFVREEVTGRESPVYPPMTRLANIIFSGTEEQAVADLAQRGTDWLRGLLKRRGGDAVTIVGPAPCAVQRIKTRWRWHVLLKSEQASVLTKVGRYFLERFEVPGHAEMRVAVDRDPVSLL